FTAPHDLDMFLFFCSVAIQHLHSFPTRRSSDLKGVARHRERPRADRAAANLAKPAGSRWFTAPMTSILTCTPIVAVHPPEIVVRSEEHTSELQSPYDLVCRLLLEKKNKTLATIE